LPRVAYEARRNIDAERQIPKLHLGLDLPVGKHVVPTRGVEGEDPCGSAEAGQTGAQIIERARGITRKLSIGTLAAWHYYDPDPKRDR